ncbi:MAG: hypothetical protein ACLFP1_06710 [Candidatus Goldiibacteriota bacterium]
MKKTIFLLMLVFAVSAGARVAFLEAERKKETVSIENIRKSEGRPVDVFAAKSGSLELFTRISGRYRGGYINAYIPRNKAEKIRAKQVFVSDSGLEGKVAYVSPAPSEVSGLYTVRLRAQNNSIPEGKIITARVKTGVIKDTVLVLNECVFPGGYVWINSNGYMEKRKIVIQGKNQKFTGIARGVRAGGHAVINYGEEFTPGEKISVHKVKGE